MPKPVAEREALIERVETLMLRGAFRPVDITRAIPEIKTGETAREYIKLVENRWAGRTSDNEQIRQRLIDEKREIIREAYTIIDDSDKTIETVARFQVDHDSKRLAQDQLDAQEVIANGAYANKTKAMAVILNAQAGIAKLLGLEVKKIEHSGNITEQRNSVIEILTTRSASHSLPGFLRSLGDTIEVGDDSVQAERDAVALPPGQGEDSAGGSPGQTPPPQA